MTNKLLAKALHSQRSGDWAGAEQVYRRILRKNARHLDANYLLGTLYAEQRNFAAARIHLQCAAEIDPRSPYVQNNLGNIHLLLGELNDAETCFRRALALNPGLAEAHNNLGNICKRRGETEAAISCYQAAIAARPDFADAAYNLGAALLDAEEPEAALPWLEQAVNRAPGSPAAHESLGTAQMKLGRKDDAVHHLRRSLELGGHRFSEAALKLARLGEGAIPENYPLDALLRTYESKAATWDHDIESSQNHFFGPEHVRMAVNQLLPGKTALVVLDAGCGTGACGAFLRPVASVLDGVDLSAPMLEQARAKNLYDRLESGDMIAFMREAPARYDLISASGVMILLGDLEAPLKAVAHALKPGGIFVFTLYSNDAEGVAIRDNLHFAHSRSHLEEKAEMALLETLFVQAVVHEMVNGAPQAGFIAALRKPLPG